jgi:pyruvate-formate lyase-activating enzyme
MSLQILPPGLRRRLRTFRGRYRWVTPRRLANMGLVHLEMKLGRTHLWSRPYELCIDVTNKCNLGCPFCPTGRKDDSGRGKGNISFDLFREIIDELSPTVATLQLFNWGEPFFNPELPKLVEYAAKRRMNTLISTNLSFKLDDERIRQIVGAGLTGLTGSIDGGDQASYEVYRRNGKFHYAIENLRKFVEAKRALGVEHPHICWQYLVFRHNEDHVEQARRIAEDIGVDNFSVIGGLYEDPSWAPEGNYAFDYLAMHANRCPWLWNKAVFHWDGGMASCCMGYSKHDDFDSWRAGDFGRMWNNEKYIAARRIWTEPDSPLPEGHYCTDCDKVRFYRGLPLHSKMKPAAGLEERIAV